MSTSSIGSVDGRPFSSRSSRNRTICSGIAARASIRSARSSASGLSASRRDLVADRGQDGGTVGVDEGLVEPAEPHAAGQVAHDGEAQLGGQHQPVEHLAGRRGQGRVGGHRFVHPVLQQRHDQLDVRRRPLLGQEHPEHRVLELAGAVDVLDAVVPQHPQQALPELVGQRGPLDVERLQVGVEPLLGRVHEVLDVLVLADRPVAAQLGEVREEGEQRDLAVDGTAPSAARDSRAVRYAASVRPSLPGSRSYPSSIPERSVSSLSASSAGVRTGSAGGSSRSSGRSVVLLGRLLLASRRPVRGVPAAPRSRPGCRWRRGAP